MTTTETRWVIVDLSAMDLRLFDGAAAAGGEGGAAAPAASGAERSVPEGAPALKSRKAGAFDNVVFGKQPNGQGIVSEPQAPDAGGQSTNGESRTTTADAEERKARYRQFKEGEFKDLFGEDVNRIVGRKTRENSALQAQIDATKPVLDMLMQRYQVADGDYKALMAKVENDNAYWSEAADEAGMSVEQYKQMQKLERENKALLEAQRRQQTAAQADQQFARWAQEAQAMEGKFKGFDLRAELQDPQFVSLLRSGVPMEHAYKVLHMDEIMGAAVMTTAAQAEQRVVQNVRAKGARPTEAAMASQGGVTYKNDVSKLTKAERAEIARRAFSGEKISF